MTTTSFQIRKEVSGTQGAVSGNLDVKEGLNVDTGVDLLSLHRAATIAVAENATAVLTKLGNTGVANEVACPSGSIILCASTGATGNTTITLPQVEAGYRITLIMTAGQAAGANDLIINAATANFYSAASIINHGVGAAVLVGIVAAAGGTDTRFQINGAATTDGSLGSILELHGLSATHWFAVFRGNAVTGQAGTTNSEFGT